MHHPPLHLDNLRTGSFWRWLGRYTLFLAALCVSTVCYAGTAVYIYLVRTMPPTPNLSQYARLAPRVTSVLAADGTLLAEWGKEHREILPYEGIPPGLIQAVIATEDRRFYAHHGVDFWGLARAIIEDIKTGKLAQGGSTITQQVAKSLLFSEKSFVRKLREMILSRQIELRFTKEEILTVYLNQVPFGHIRDRGVSVYGIQAAARFYFNTDAKQLSLHQSALLAGMIQAPTRYSPFGDSPDKAEKRKNQVLQNMVEAGFLSVSEADTWKQQPMHISPRRDLFHENAPYFVDHVKTLVKSIFQQQFPTLPDPIETGGYRIETTLIPYADRLAAENVDHAVRKLDKRQGYRRPIAHIEKTFAKPGAPPTQWEALRTALAQWYPQPAHPTALRIGLVDQVDSDAALVWVGAQRFTLPLANMKWAYKFSKRDSVNDQAIASARQALRVGDIIWVRFQSTAPRRPFTDYEPFVQVQPDGFAVTDVAWLPPKEAPATSKPLLILEQDPRPQGSLLSFDVHNGYVWAMVGGSDYQNSQFNRITRSCRQPGSAYKPVYYSLALDKGYNYDSMWHDKVKQEIDPVTGAIWTPKNVDDKHENWVSLERALIWSKNPPALEIFKKLGAQEVKNWARQLGFTTPIHADDALALGASCVRIDEISSIFSLFPRNGDPLQLVYIKRIVDPDGKTIYQQADWWDPEIDPAARIDRMTTQAGWALPPRIAPRTAWLTERLLRKVITEGHSAMIRATRLIAAGKTGTSSRTSDAWFIGHTSRTLTTAWVGDDTYERELGLRDASFTISVPLWTRYMVALSQYATDNLLRELPWARPPGVSPNDRGGNLFNEQPPSNPSTATPGKSKGP